MEPAEQQAVEAYPTLIEVASTEELKQSLQQHAARTQEQVQRLQQLAQVELALLCGAGRLKKREV